MIKWLFKYGAVIFLFNTLLFSIESVRPLGNIIFLGAMALFALLLFINPKQIKYIIFHKAFTFFLIINVLNLLYFILFHGVFEIEALKYILARGVQFSVISFSIYFHYDYYKSKFLDHLVYLIFAIVLISLVFNPYLFSGRYSGIIWNPNMFSSLVVIAFSALFLKNKTKSNFDYVMLFSFFLMALVSGSRGSIVAIILVYLLKYGFSFRNLLYGVIAFAFAFTISSINLDTSLNRFVEQSMFNDRILQYEYAILSIKHKLFIGYGLDKYAYINRSLVPVFLKGKIIGAHNGYLAILTQYGIIFGGLMLYIIFQQSYKLISFFRNSLDYERVYVFIIIYTLIASLYETLITGVNEFQTILFWFALAFLSYSKFNQENAN
jgi:O-antigen ligase